MGIRYKYINYYRVNALKKKKKNTTCEHFCSTSNNYLKTTYYLFKI